ncbi:hypothetical protein ACFE04_010644 [Oxalis oulophora]
MKSQIRTFKELPVFLAAVVILGLLLIAGFIGLTNKSYICNIIRHNAPTDASGGTTTSLQLLAVVHYATSRAMPQQSITEINQAFNVLKRISPCNFLVYGLGHDSLMWAALNPGGTTLFIEEDPKWAYKVLLHAPSLRVHTFTYRTRLSDADDLLATYKFEPQCLPANVRLKDNTRCKLAVSELPDAVYDTEWDVIMIDGPRGYFGQAPGRMGVIFSSAVMARGRKSPGNTHVFLHDVNRKVERVYAETFLCKKYLVKAVGRLWHFEIPPSVNHTSYC